MEDDGGLEAVAAARRRAARPATDPSFDMEVEMEVEHVPPGAAAGPAASKEREEPVKQASFETRVIDCLQCLLDH
eukprot:6188573-Pleurochrysis_carterae.AAC.2